jgi:SNF2 family DNA or RNA helicase
MHSIFDFVMPGYLGTPNQFKTEFATPIEADRDARRAESLRRITSPFLLRRLKTDATVITDLPQKVVQDDYADLKVGQVRLVVWTASSTVLLFFLYISVFVCVLVCVC